MKKQASIRLSAISLAFLGLASTATAAEFDDYGRVLRVSPNIEQVNHPRQECYTEYAPAPQPQSRGVGGSIIGGIAGGILGNQVGGGSGRTVATAAGAITGAIVGDRMENNNQVASQQPVQRCRSVDHWQSRTNGYSVTYEYRGQTYTTMLPYDPGERVRLRVSATPY